MKSFLSPLCVITWSLFFGTTLLGIAQAGRRKDEPLSLRPHLLKSMQEQIDAASDCINKWQSNPQDRIAAVYLHSHLLATWRDQLLTCSINRVIDNMSPHTPLDIYVFVREAMYQKLSKTMVKDLGEEKATKVCLLPIPDIQWQYQQPRDTPYLLPNNTNRFKEYLFMGQWRLLVPFNIMHHLGYPYVLQLDDDLFLPKPFEVNVLDYMRKNNKKLATHRVASEKPWIMWGLPEMARFFLVSNHLRPGTSLLGHVRPPAVQNLITMQPGSERGYDTSVLWGNFLIMSTDLWAEPKVQDWIALCMTSGGMERHRWQEQGVIAFIWLMFTNEEELWQLQAPEFEYIHGRGVDQTQSMCGEGVVNPLAR